MSYMVSGRDYDRLQLRYEATIKSYNELVGHYNTLVKLINDAGGLPLGAMPFTEEEIGMMIRLCHPDKHNGSAAATHITQRLLEIRG